MIGPQDDLDEKALAACVDEIAGILRFGEVSGVALSYPFALGCLKNT